MDRGFGAVIVAAGNGTRMGTKESKQYLPLKNKPVVIHTLERFQSLPECKVIVWVVSAQDDDRCQRWVQEYQLNKVRHIIAGGVERQQSVYAGLQALQRDQLDYVCIHDGVRPFIDKAKIKDCYMAAQKYRAAVLAVPVKDTIKQVNKEGSVVATLDRRNLWFIQTPQVFRLGDIITAHQQAAAEGFSGTDDATLVERIGITVSIIIGDEANMKLTTPADFRWAKWWASNGDNSHQ